MLDLATLWLLIWLIKNAAMDISCAVKGTPNPRYEAKKAKARARAAQQQTAPPRYGTRDWWEDFLADGLQAQTEWRRRRAAEKRRARQLADVEHDQADVVDVDDEPGPRPVVHDGRTADPATGPRWGWSCRRPGCPGKGFDFDSEDDAAAAARQHRCPDTGTSPGEGVQILGGDRQVPTNQAGDQPAQTSGPDAGGAPDPEQNQQPRQPEPMATVIPFPNRTQQEDTVSTDVNSEVIGLDQSIAYAKSLASFAGEHGPAGNEGYIGHLTGSKVTGAGLSTAHEMQDAFGTAAAAAERHAQALERQRSVQEAYDATPDAGDKDFQTQGR